MATLTLTPNPTEPGSNLMVSGSGFDPKRKVQLALDGSGWTTNYFRPTRTGTFQVGMNVSTTAKTQTVSARYADATKVVVAKASIVVAVAPTGIVSKTAASIADIKAWLRDDTVDEIVVANGTYHVSPAAGQAADSLWIGSQFASRTRPITVRAATAGGVTFDGGGAQGGGLSFNGGSHDQTWDGFRFANLRPNQTGVIVFGGYGLPASHHITLRNLTMLPSITGVTDHQDHCIYFSMDGAHDILIEDYTATPGSLIQSALQFTHDPNVYNVTVRRMHVTGTQNTILIYTPSAHDILIEDSDITNARDCALNVNECGANVVLRRVVSVNSHGTYFPSGQPAGLTMDQCTWG